MNDHERRLVGLLDNALNGDLENGIKEFEEYYWPFERDVLPWDSDLDRSIHELASDLNFLSLIRSGACILFRGMMSYETKSVRSLL